MLDFLGSVFSTAGVGPRSSEEDAEAGPGAPSGGFAVLAAAPLSAALDMRVEVLETLLTYLEVRVNSLHLWGPRCMGEITSRDPGCAQ